jgi:hypothetical protein
MITSFLALYSLLLSTFPTCTITFPVSCTRLYRDFDQGIKFCSIFKVFGMRRKKFHCVRLVFLIPTVYLLSQTESVWRRYRNLFAKANRQNFWDDDCTCPYSPYGDVAGLYHPYGDVADG